MLSAGLVQVTVLLRSDGTSGVMPVLYCGLLMTGRAKKQRERPRADVGRITVLLGVGWTTERTSYGS